MQAKWKSIKKQYDRASDSWEFKRVFGFLDANPKKDQRTYGNLGIGGVPITSNENIRSIYNSIENAISTTIPTIPTTTPTATFPRSSSPLVPQLNVNNSAEFNLNDTFYTDIPNQNSPRSPQLSSPIARIRNRNFGFPKRYQN